MPISFACPNCKSRVRIQNGGPGQSVFCPSCGHKIRLKAPQPAASSAPPPADFDRTIMAKEAPALSRTAPPPPADFDRTVMAKQAPARLPPPAVEDGTMMAQHAPSRPPAGPPALPRRPKRSLLGSPFLWASLCLVLLAAGAGCYFLFFSARTAQPTMTQGIIEVGSTGVKALGVHFFSTSSGFDWETKFKGDRNVNLGTLTPERKFRPEAMEELKGALREFVEKLKAEAKLPEGDIRVVSSSGVFSQFKSDEERVAAQKELTAAVQSAVGKEIDCITVQDESRYGLLASIRPEERKEFVLIDIGGGNTKGGYFDDQNQFHPMSDCPGVKAYYKLVKAVKDDPFATTAAEKRDEWLGTPLKEAVNLKPGLESRNKVLLIGGIVWAMTNMVHPDNRDVRVPLTAADIDLFSFLVRSTNDPQKLRAGILAKVSDDKVRAEVEKELKKVQETFSPDQLIAGSEILRALSKELHLGNNKQIVFFRKGHLAWPMGYLLEKGKIVP